MKKKVISGILLLLILSLLFSINTYGADDSISQEQVKDKIVQEERDEQDESDQKDKKPEKMIEDKQQELTKKALPLPEITQEPVENNVQAKEINPQPTNSVDDQAAEIEVEYEYDAVTNTVKVILRSDKELQDTKPTWDFGADKKTYSKVYRTNMSYNTPVVDQYGNTIVVHIEITEIDDQPAEVEVEYEYDAVTNTVKVILRSDKELQDTKPTWDFGADKKTYSKVYRTNMNYNTPVVDQYGNTIVVHIEITEIDDQSPEIEVKYEYDAVTNTVLVTMISNEKLGNTKPTWDLSEDELSYSKVFGSNMEYSTGVSDQYGNMTIVPIKVYYDTYNFQNNDFKVQVQYLMNQEREVIVTLKSNQELADTKPTWNLSEDKKSYTKAYHSNMSYITRVENTQGDTLDVTVGIYAYRDVKLGIDVSKYNGDIDWKAVRRSGIDFAIIRAGYRGWGAAGNFAEDSKFRVNVENALNAKMNIGLYMFSQAINEAEAIEEAEYVLNKIAQYGISESITYPIVIDTEASSAPNGTGRADGLSVQERTDVCRAFCQRIQQAGYTPMIYASKNWLRRNLDMSQLGGYDVWLAHYNGTTDPFNNGSDYEGTYQMWQYTSSGSVLGISGNVDMNICYKDY